MGRFGNQMFQLASTIGIARSLGYDPAFPMERFVNNGNPDSYSGCKLLDCFNIPEEMIVPESQIRIEYGYNESDFRYNHEVKYLRDNTSLLGYFQTEKYFLNCEEEIRRIFEFNDSIKEAASRTKIENGISVHFRRGDYLNSSGYHPTQTLEYYQKAMSYMSLTEGRNFYIFSDDIDWCKNNLKSGSNILYVESKSPYIDMYLMSQCDGHIIANSSFSWWGAWLSGKRNVIAPSNWFGPMINKNTEDVYCKEWKII